jgi:hypothetical protein
MIYQVSISGKHYNVLQSHLYSGDSREAVAIALCGKYADNNHTKLLVHEIVPIPYDICKIRESDLIIWPTDYLIPYLQKANKFGYSIIKIHCHPGGGEYFSSQDDRADGELFPSLYGWIDDADIHASCIMLPDGRLFGRVITEDLQFSQIERIMHIGDKVQIWNYGKYKIENHEQNLRNRQAFGDGTVQILKGIKVAIVGCSGTGSPVFEQLTRLGVGVLLLIDPDVLEEKNLNRILNSTLLDAKSKRKKVDVLEEAAGKTGFNTKIETIDADIYSDISIVNKISGCDFIFGCVDSIDARHLLNQISTFYLVPYIDIGVFLKSDGNGGVDYITGTVHYIQPGGSSLISRGVYTSEELRASLMKKYDPKAFLELKKEKYIVDVNVDSPAVISVNMQLSAVAVNEFLSKIHGFRGDDSKDYAIVRVDILNGYQQNEQDGEPDDYLRKYVGRGSNIKPILNMPELDVKEGSLKRKKTSKVLTKIAHWSLFIYASTVSFEMLIKSVSNDMIVLAGFGTLATVGFFTQEFITDKLFQKQINQINDLFSIKDVSFPKWIKNFRKFFISLTITCLWSSMGVNLATDLIQKGKFDVDYEAINSILFDLAICFAFIGFLPQIVWMFNYGINNYVERKERTKNR